MLLCEEERFGFPSNYGGIFSLVYVKKREFQIAYSAANWELPRSRYSFTEKRLRLVGVFYNFLAQVSTIDLFGQQLNFNHAHTDQHLT